MYSEFELIQKARWRILSFWFHFNRNVALKNPDFAALARAYGAFGARIEKTAEFPDVFEEARKAGKPALLELVVDPEALTPNASLSEIRENALKKSN